MFRWAVAERGTPAASISEWKYGQDMLGLVRVALKRPYTFAMALLILIVGPLAALRTPVDIFPEIRIPVIAVVWQQTGLPPDQMSGRVMLNFQRSLTTTVNNIEQSGLTAGDRVIESPPNGLANGDVVRVVNTAKVPAVR